MNAALVRLRTSVRDLPQALILPGWTTGVLVVIVGFTGSLVLTLPVAPCYNEPRSTHMKAFLLRKG